ncbi:hypothetical protein BWQ96_05765 [Gracilariopsis chorda]|uniref:Uncharacterized protein n=1 Tax=Gracilariopsis chorda TaxID=448386 RepID=A0A2V3IQX2_9FLOR|nr:hypothetical protein BWQ96_05765 [Gracilariopsis chorda]|eukprot:PXF44493.1 hypothetical protein BWQ96_05765 [Gracilariopsis chorda]
MRFSAALDLVLLKSVTAFDAHVPPDRGIQSRFEEAMDIFISSAPTKAFDNACAPTWKTLSDLFKKILCEHHTAVKSNAVASGIIEVRGERKTLPDDVMLEVDEWDEKRRSERTERTDLEKRLLLASNEIRTKALSRTKQSEHVATTDEGCSVRSVERTKRKKRGPVTVDSDEEERDLVEIHVAATKDMDTKPLMLEQDRLHFDRNKVAWEVDRQKRLDECESRRLSLDERRVDLETERTAADRDDRSDIRAERRQMVAVFVAFVKKLQ